MQFSSEGLGVCLKGRKISGETRGGRARGEVAATCDGSPEGCWMKNRAGEMGGSQTATGAMLRSSGFIPLSWRRVEDFGHG